MRRSRRSPRSTSIYLAGPCAVVPLASPASGVGRLVLDRRWSTDAIGGYIAG
ncbi:MAG TPA: hypothetical protein VL242_53475 [Sorangium sp.]|uniref:hypothetical protein n=1 Tax=Sorangium sp. So ce1153 TaxID=3133333 RepID=UPI002BDE1E38|nr:hypothetical protein [Sorangium sp.]